MASRPVALVTGAGSGIGAAVAGRIADAGARVLAAGRNELDLQQVVGTIVEAGGEAEALRLDVTDAAAVARLAELERVDWLVNNAGVAISAGLLAMEREELLELHLAVNFHGARRVMEALLPGMKERRAGSIVNVASSAGLQGYAYVSAYCASKHALVGYSRAAAEELAGTGVSVNLVCPHYVDSPMTDRSVANIVEKTGRSEAETRAFFASQNPGGRLVTVGEVAAAVVGLLRGGKTAEIVELDGSDPAETPEGAGGGS